MNTSEKIEIVVIDDANQCERGIKMINETYIITAPPRFDDIPFYLYQKLGHKRNYKYHK